MKRNLDKLTNVSYDLIVIGGGIFGICTAWEAILRGLSVALVEKADFGHATSASCFKMVHGGMRYLQHGDVVRLRESARERSILLRIAPHLVHPLPIVVPTYGYGKNSKAFLATGLFLYDLLTWDRNRHIKDPDRQIPLTRLFTRDEILHHFPGIERHGLSGAVVFCDGQMYSPQRLALSFLLSAADAGVTAANYVKAESILIADDRVIGVRAQDLITDRHFEIRGQTVLNAAGPWTEGLLNSEHNLTLKPRSTFSRDAYFTTQRCLHQDLALAVQARTRDPDALLSRSARHLFLVPWRGGTIVGVWHVVHQGGPEQFAVTENDLKGFLDEINWAYPSLKLELSEVSRFDAGLVLFGENDPEVTDLSYGKRSRIVDHAREHGVEGLLSLIGIRYTTARGDAEKVVDLMLRKMGRTAPRSNSDSTPVYGGDIENVSRLIEQAIDRWRSHLDPEVITELVRHHGKEYQRVTQYLAEEPKWSERIGNSSVIAAEVVHAVRSEMALTLNDIVFRRTTLGATEHPELDDIAACANIMAHEMGWDAGRTRAEIKAVEQSLRENCPAMAPSMDTPQ